MQNEVILQDVVIKFAGDSGDGMQLTGQQFTNNTALLGIDLATFPDFPAEIRAPLGTVPGVSGFQIHFSSNRVYTPGDVCDVLVAMNAAALKVNLKGLKKGGKIIANLEGFDTKNLRLAAYTDGVNPLEDGSLDGYELVKVDVTKLTREALKEYTELGNKERDRAKNMFVLGLIYWIYNRNLETTIEFLKDKFGKKPTIFNSNVDVLKAGYFYGETAELFTTRYKVEKSKMEAGHYRSIMGNQALSMGLIAGSQKSGLPLFLGSYPITPATDILHELSKYKNFGIRTFQAEDEIAGISAAIGASYGGSIGLTTTSGPGMALKTEALGLAMMLEIPLVIINVQRGGPSTGLPTKTEQSDLYQAVYGRNGDAPMPVIAARSPVDCFDCAVEAVRIAVEYMTPVMLLTDGYIANAAEPWLVPDLEEYKPFPVEFLESVPEDGFKPYSRDHKLKRPWVKPGTPGLLHRIGGIEKEVDTGHINYAPANHQAMTDIRSAKVNGVADSIPDQIVEQGAAGAKLAVVGWGSTYGPIKQAVRRKRAEGVDVAHVHIRHIWPMPKNMAELLKSFDKIIVPEMNTGQLKTILRDQFLVDAQPVNKVSGQPFTIAEIEAAIGSAL